MLTQNPPDKRLAFIVKTYLPKQPWVVWDTLSVIFNTIGIDQPAKLIADAALDGVATPAGMTTKQFAFESRDMFRAGTMLSGLPDPSWDHRPVPQVEPTWQYPTKQDADRWRTHRYSSLIFDSPMYWKEPNDGMWKMLVDVIPLVTSKSFADGLMNEPHNADGVFPWIARELSKLSKYVIAATDKASSEFSSFDEYELYTETLDALRRRTNAIAAWAKKNRIDLNKLTLAEVLEDSKHFKVKAAVPQGVVKMRFPSGWTIQELRGRGRLDPEGAKLQHCVGSYCSRVERGEAEIYSLRDPDGVPYVTMEVHPPTGHFMQVFGSENSDVGSDGFNAYVFEEGQANNPPLKKDEVPEVVEAIKRMLEEFIDERSGGHLPSLSLANVNLTSRIQEAIRATRESLRVDRSIDLSGMKLPDIDLSGFDLRETELTQTVLRGAQLNGANLERAEAPSAVFAGANLEHANMQEMQATNAVFGGANLSDAKMVAIKAGDASFVGAKLLSADLRFAYLVKANFSGADLGGANLSNATLKHADLVNADLSGANLSGVRDLEQADTRRATYNGATRFPEGFEPKKRGMIRDDSPTTWEGRERARAEGALGFDDGPFWDDGEHEEHEDDEEEDDDW